jgi:hypothetical protein
MEEDLPLPIPIYKDKLINNLDQLDELEKEYQNFVNETKNNFNIDYQMKEIMIKTREEYINNLKKQKIIENKTNTINILINEIEKYENNNKKYVLNSLNSYFENYINSDMKNIILDYELYYEIFTIINNIEDKDTIINILSIFKPDDFEKFNEYSEIIKLSKNDYEIFQKKNEETILIRKLKLENLLNNLDRLSGFDKQTKNLKNVIINSIEDFINLKCDKIIISENEKDNFMKFINSIRIVNENKNFILNVIFFI